MFKTSLAYQNWKSKYQYNNETPLETQQRVARAAASAEKENQEQWYQTFLNTLVKFDSDNQPLGLKCTFGGRITANVGTHYTGTTSKNCFINGPVSNASISYRRPVPGTDEFIDVSYTTQGTPDSLSNIMLTLLEQAETLKSEGGYGINFDFIRPRGSLIKGIGIKHPGVVHYMTIWDTVANVIVMGDSDGYKDNIKNHSHLDEDVVVAMKKQARKGAQLAALSVWHPDVEEFIRAKQEPGRLTKFNISVLVDDEFMDAVRHDKLYTQWFWESAGIKLEGAEYEAFSKGCRKFVKANVSGKMTLAPSDLVKGSVVYRLAPIHEYKRVAADYYVAQDGTLMYKKEYKRVRARELCDLMLLSAYNRAEPGIIYYDSMQRNNPLAYLGDANAMNPCGEIPGNPYTSTVCLLGSVNLTQYVNQDRTFDWDGYVRDVCTFARMLDNVNDLDNLPLPQYRWASENIRQYGMGINGLGSALFMMGIPFNSVHAMDFVNQVTWLKEEHTWRTSALLAKERGAFPAYSSKFLETNWFTEFTGITEDTKNLIRKYGVRNGKTTGQPPLGNSSIICDIISNGIEPVFLPEYKRTYIADKWPEGITKENVKTILSQTKQGDSVVWEGVYNGVSYLYEPHNRGLCINEVVRDYGYQWVLDNYPQDFKSGTPSYIVTANTLTVQEHLDVQEIVQRNCNQAVSKTANLPNDYDFDDFRHLYIKAWKADLNGFTTYRDGSMESVLSKVEASKSSKEPRVVKKDIKLPDTFINGEMRIIKREGKKWYLHFSYLPEDTDKIFPVAIWIQTNNLGEIREANAAVKQLIELLEKFEIPQTLIELQKQKIKDNPGYVRVGKLISMCLRHNIPLPNIVAALDSVPDVYVTDLLFALKKFLVEHIEDGTRVLNSLCKSCGSSEVVFESGCNRCLDCGSSECG